MNNIVDCETDHNYHGYRLCHSELPPLEHHDGHDAENYDEHTLNRQNRQYNISCGKKQYDKCKANGCNDSCDRRIQEGSLRLHPAPVTVCCLHG